MSWNSQASRGVLVAAVAFVVTLGVIKGVAKFFPPTFSARARVVDTAGGLATILWDDVWRAAIKEMDLQTRWKAKDSTESLGDDAVLAMFRKKVDVRVPRNSKIYEIRAWSTTSDEAVAIANQVIRVITTQNRSAKIIEWAEIVKSPRTQKEFTRTSAVLVSAMVALVAGLIVGYLPWSNKRV